MVDSRFRVLGYHKLGTWYLPAEIWAFDSVYLLFCLQLILDVKYTTPSLFILGILGKFGVFGVLFFGYTPSPLQADSARWHLFEAMT